MDIRDPQTATRFMARATELAMLGRGRVSPNPLVGCVIAHDGIIIGEGWHQKYGEAHAEANAIHSVDNKSLLPESVMFVTLEPCSHLGKTPPCTDLIIEHGINKVVIANPDSNPNVAGKGADRLRAAGVEVITGVLEAECRHMNRRFFTFVERKRPYIILKWAESWDRFMGGGASQWVSTEISRQLVHRWRTEEDGVLVGTGTARADNPRLNVRDWTGRNPVRIIIDRYLRLDPSLHVFDGSQMTICYNVLKEEEKQNLILAKVNENNFIPEMMGDLYRRKVQSVIVEGGAVTLGLFIQAGLWDEARVFRSKQHFGEGIAAPALKATLVSHDVVSEDILLSYWPVDTPHHIPARG